MLVLGRMDLEKLLAPRDVADAIAAAFRRHAAGLTRVPERNLVPVTADGVLLVMPAVARAERGGDVTAGAKLVTWYGGNRARGEPTVFGTYVLLDGPTGRPIAIVDGKTYKELAVDYGSNPGESIFHGQLRGRPNEEVTEAYWREGEGALPEAQKQLLKPVFERLISRSLPELVRKLKLIPSAT